MCLFTIFIVSCKSSKIATVGDLDASLTSKAVIREHYDSQLRFKTLSGKLKIAYNDGESTQTLSVSLRMEKDKAIWISAPLGIVKAYITPNRVSFYNKLQNEYFDGDFSFLSNLLGASLDFEQVQNLLLGQAIFNLKEQKYEMAVTAGNYELKPIKPGPLFKVLFQIEPQNFKMAIQQLSQPLKKRLLQINYRQYQKINKWILPDEIAIATIEGDKRNTIDIEYRNMEFNQNLSFPYKIPNGFDKIVLDSNDL
ncbi:MAG: DUF4292 domain-containing protein [Flavobacteriales bacterium]|nr:MAG: DUF4292 domain-containing protein [Flavobacteriales bacterium]